MSDSIGLIAISFFGLAGSFLLLYIANSAAALNGQILTGVIRGAPVSVGGRRSLLLMVWLPYQVLGTISMLFVALVEMRRADQVRDADIKLLAQAFAFIAVASALLFLSNGVFGTRNYGRYLRRIKESELRQAEAD